MNVKTKPKQDLRRYVYRLGVKYRKHSSATLSGENGQPQCPCCGACDSFEFVEEEMQLGFFHHKYFEYLECTDCAYHAVLIMNVESDYYNVR